MAGILELLGLTGGQTPMNTNQSPILYDDMSGFGSMTAGAQPQAPMDSPQQRAGVLNQTQQPGILDRMGFATDNFGGRLANALMSAGSADPAATLARLQASDRDAKQVKRTSMGNGAFVLEEYPDGTSKIVPNTEVRSYNERMAANKQKPPAGYRYTADGDLEVIPGGPVDKKDQKAREAEDSKINMAMGTADNTIAAVDKALGILEDNQVGPVNLAGGIIGQMTKGIGQTPAFNLVKAADTVKANVGFQQLQAMREASPTGGALGQVAVQELNFLQAAIASLDTAQSPEILAENLRKVKTHFENWKRTVNQARQQPNQGSGNTSPPPGGAPKAPAGNDAASRAQGYLN